MREARAKEVRAATIRLCHFSEPRGICHRHRHAERRAPPRRRRRCLFMSPPVYANTTCRYDISPGMRQNTPQPDITYKMTPAYS